MDYLYSDFVASFSEFEASISTISSAPRQLFPSMAEQLPDLDAQMQGGQFDPSMYDSDQLFNYTNPSDGSATDYQYDSMIDFMCDSSSDANLFNEKAVGEAAILASLRSGYYIFTVFLVAPLCVVGVAGNLLCLLVLCGDCGLSLCCSRSHCRRRCGGSGAMGVLLRSLSAGNLVFLAFGLLVRIATDFSCFLSLEASSYTRFISTWFMYLHQLGSLCHMFVSYVVLLIALERHLAARRPLERRNFLTTNRVRNCVVAVFVGSVLFHLPKFFEGQIKSTQLPLLDHHNGHNFSASAKLFLETGRISKSDPIFSSNYLNSNNKSAQTGQMERSGALLDIWRASSWTKSVALSVAYEVLYTCTTQVVPVLVALVCTLLLVHTLRRARHFSSDHQKFPGATPAPSLAGESAPPTPATNAAMRMQAARVHAVCRRHGKGAAFFERGSFLALFTIVLFILAETPFFVFNLLCLRITIAKALWPDDKAAATPPQWLSLLEKFATACLYLQSCSNLFVYCLLSSNFRRRLRALFCSSRCCERLRSRHNTSSFHAGGLCGDRGCGGSNGDHTAPTGVVLCSSVSISANHIHNVHSFHSPHSIQSNGHIVLTNSCANGHLSPSRRFSAGQMANPNRRMAIVQLEQVRCHSGRTSPSVHRPIIVGHRLQHSLQNSF